MDGSLSNSAMLNNSIGLATTTISLNMPLPNSNVGRPYLTPSMRSWVLGLSGLDSRAYPCICGGKIYFDVLVMIWEGIITMKKKHLWSWESRLVFAFWSHWTLERD